MWYMWKNSIEKKRFHFFCNTRLMKELRTLKNENYRMTWNELLFTIFSQVDIPQNFQADYKLSFDIINKNEKKIEFYQELEERTVWKIKDFIVSFKNYEFIFDYVLSEIKKEKGDYSLADSDYSSSGQFP